MLELGSLGTTDPEVDLMSACSPTERMRVIRTFRVGSLSGELDDWPYSLSFIYLHTACVSRPPMPRDL